MYAWAPAGFFPGVHFFLIKVDTLFLVVALKTQVLTVTANAQNTTTFPGGEVPPLPLPAGTHVCMLSLSVCCLFFVFLYRPCCVNSTDWLIDCSGVCYMLLFYSVTHMKHSNTDPAAIYTARNSVRLHPAQAKLIQVSLCVILRNH